MSDISLHALGAALLIGLLSGVHCSSMCGGLVAAFSGGAAARHKLALNGGRVFSYALAGGIVGGAGTALMHAPGAQVLHTVFLVLANVLLIAAGLNLAGIAKLTAFLERAGMPLWQRLQPLLRGLLPLSTPGRSFAAGAIWGWLPCGMTYAVLPSALASGNAIAGAAIMLAFGVGTLPNLLALAVMWNKLRAAHLLAQVRMTAGLIIVAVGIFGLVSLATNDGTTHQQHQHHHTA